MAIFNYVQLLAVMLLLWQCNDHETPLTDRDVRFNEVFMISEGEQVKVTGEAEQLLLKLGQVQDSRCPTDATCVWAGNATIELVASNRLQQDQRLELCIGDCQTGPIRSNHIFKKEIGGVMYEFTLLDVTPYPTIKPSDRKREAKLLIKPEIAKN